MVRRTLLHSPLVLSLGLLAAGPAVLAGPRGPALGDAARSPTGYDWAVHADLGAMPGPVTALAVVPQGVLAAHAPANRIDLVDPAGAVTTEAQLQYGVSAMTADGARASTAAAGVPGAADLHLRGAGMWSLEVDDPADVAVVGVAGGDVVLAVGAPGQDGRVHVLGRGGWQLGAAALPGALPTAVAGGRRDGWIGAAPSSGSGPALLFQLGRRGAAPFALPPPVPALGPGELQQVDALLALDGGLVVALGVRDAGGAVVRGDLLLIAGGRRPTVRSVGAFATEAALSLAAADGSVYVGTSAGRLLHLAGGAWSDEPGLPANLSVTALAVDASGRLLAGVHTAAGPRLLRRTAKVPAPPPPPAAPTNLAATAPASDRVTLSWTDASNDETSFEVQRAAAGTAMFAKVGAAPMNATTFADTTVAAATAYDYRVVAVNASGASPPSNTATVTTPAAPPPPVAPVAPTNLVATAPASDRVDLTWTDASNDETSFEVQRAAAGTTMFAKVGAAPMNATTFADTTVAAATAYDYRVVAVNAGGASTPSNTATVTTPAAPPPPPAAPTYLADVKPILAGKNLLGISCAGCHSSGRPYQLSPGLTDDQADYTSTLRQVNTATPTASELLTRPTQQRGHPLKLLDVGSAEYDTIVRWIQGGTKFN